MASTEPRILTTTVGSYPVPEWLAATPSDQALDDATRVVFDTQRQAGIDLPTDGELYRFDKNHPDTNGMIDYFVSRMGGCSTEIGRSTGEKFQRKHEMAFRVKPAAVVTSGLSEGSLNVLDDCRRTASLAGGKFKFTLTSPYMLARTLLDEHYGEFGDLTMGIATVMSAQVRGLPCDCIQIDEANIPGNLPDAKLAAEAINTVLDAIDPGTQKAVHFCFGNYGGQTIQAGSWKAMSHFLNSLHVDHLVLELAHRPEADIEALADIKPAIGLGIGVVNIKANHIETPEQIAASIEKVEKRVGEGRVKFVHPDCGFWMLKRSIADRKIAALAKGRDLYLGRSLS